MKTIDEIIKENSSSMIEFAGTELYYKEDEVKKMIRAGISQALIMAAEEAKADIEETVNGFFAPVVRKKSILFIKERIK